MGVAGNLARRPEISLAMLALLLIGGLALIKGTEAVNVSLPERQPMLTPTPIKGPCPEILSLISNYTFFVMKGGQQPGEFMKDFLKNRQDLPGFEAELDKGLQGNCIDVRPEESILTLAKTFISVLK